MFKFDKELWNVGRKIEDSALPLLNNYFECNFERNENNIFDILDFKDEKTKKIVEVKGRRIKSTAFKDTIITASKVNAGLQKIDDGYKVYFVFVFTDKVGVIELKEDMEFKVKFTGSNCIQHYLIPVKDLKIIQEL
jgi:anaerobic ribonucleoside-triphosphate reductase